MIKQSSSAPVFVRTKRNRLRKIGFEDRTHRIEASRGGWFMNFKSKLETGAEEV